jgi:adenylylsulfate kinase
MLEETLRNVPLNVEVLDGDELRKLISSDLGFTKEDREKHVKRVAFLSNLLARNGVVSIVALISPYRSMRQYVRENVHNFTEVWVKCSLETCKRRDPKGLYKKAESGTISNFTGIQDTYEPPLKPEIVVDTEEEMPTQCVEKILNYLRTNKYIVRSAEHYAAKI